MALQVLDSFHRALPVIHLGIVAEVKTTAKATTLFRGNSMSTKLMSAFTRHTGIPYLRATLGPLVRQVIARDPALVEVSVLWCVGVVLNAQQGGSQIQSGRSGRQSGAAEGALPVFPRHHHSLGSGMEEQVVLCVRFADLLSLGSRCPFRFGGWRGFCTTRWRCASPTRRRRVWVAFCSCASFVRPCSRPSTTASSTTASLRPPPRQAKAKRRAYVFFSYSSSSSVQRRPLTLVSKVLQNLSNDVSFGTKEAFLEPLNKVSLQMTALCCFLLLSKLGMLQLLVENGPRLVAFFDDVINIPETNPELVQYEPLTSVADCKARVLPALIDMCVSNIDKVARKMVDNSSTGEILPFCDLLAQIVAFEGHKGREHLVDEDGDE